MAYEPVWAIGSGQAATPEQAQDVCAKLRDVIAEKLGRGCRRAHARALRRFGEVLNIASFMREPDVDGALVGGASLVVDEFAAIIRYQKHVGSERRPVYCDPCAIRGIAAERLSTTVQILEFVLQVLLGITSLLLTLLILLHKGRGGGLSDMFGGGMTSALGSSGLAERNLNRFTVILALTWFISIVALGLITKFQGI